MDADGKTLTVKLARLRPTQMAVRYDEVGAKRSKWRALSPEGKLDFLASHPFPAIYGPGARYFIVDGHHMALALLREGVDAVSVRFIEDLSDLEANRFFVALQERGLICPSREPRGLAELPHSLHGLADDPFRGLVARLRRDCGCPKDQTTLIRFIAKSHHLIYFSGHGDTRLSRFLA